MLPGSLKECGTGDVIVVHALQVGGHEGGLRCVVHRLQHIGNVHDDMPSHMKLVAASINYHHIGLPAVKVATHTTIPDGVASQIGRRLRRVLEHIAAGVAGLRQHPPVAVMALSLRQTNIAQLHLALNHFHLLEPMRHDHLTVQLVLHDDEHFLRQLLISGIVYVVSVQMGQQHAVHIP